MESIFRDPKQVKALIEQGMQGKLEEGELDALEFEQLEEALEPPPNVGKKKEGQLSLKGEGGSGEKKRDWNEGAPPLTKDTTIENWAEGVVEGSKDDWHEDREDGESQESGGIRERVVRIEKELAHLKAYMEDQARAFNAMIAPLQSRVQHLEVASAPVVPLATLPSTHTRGGSRGGAKSPPRPGTKSGVGVPRVGSTSPAVSQAAVEAFVAKNRDYPSVGAIRRAKLNQLQSVQGLPGLPVEIQVSDWTVEGIYKALKQVHEDK